MIFSRSRACSGTQPFPNTGKPALQHPCKLSGAECQHAEKLISWAVTTHAFHREGACAGNLLFLNISGLQLQLPLQWFAGYFWWRMLKLWRTWAFNQEGFQMLFCPAQTASKISFTPAFIVAPQRFRMEIFDFTAGKIRWKTWAVREIVLNREMDMKSFSLTHALYYKHSLQALLKYWSAFYSCLPCFTST